MLSPATISSRRVLIADDDPVMRRLVSSIVEGEGFTAVAVADGREAFKILQSDSDFRAGIFDMMMPHLQGLDIIRHMRTEKRLMRVPVILITAESDFSLMSNSFTAGATAFLQKPFTTEQLRNVLRILPDRKS
ncbi:MAG: two-component system, chemotaxis family, chemotaxis protein CheY [Acidobacteriota bacterium]|jgi:CheY-like chemotaxis protein|nr:two-component system, chemotaxis family, chemotaxis protein CheY [Acidobacteriota bacterium]